MYFKRNSTLVYFIHTQYIMELFDVQEAIRAPIMLISEKKDVGKIKQNQMLIKSSKNKQNVIEKSYDALLELLRLHRSQCDWRGLTSSLHIFSPGEGAMERREKEYFGEHRNVWHAVSSKCKSGCSENPRATEHRNCLLQYRKSTILGAHWTLKKAEIQVISVWLSLSLPKDEKNRGS